VDWGSDCNITGVVLAGLLGYKLLTDTNSPYPYADEELYKPWIMKRIKKLNQTAKI